MKANEKKCPRCAEVIKKEAVVCKHCGYAYSENEIAEQKATDAKNTKNGMLGCFGLVVVIALIGMCSRESAPSNESASVVEQVTNTAEENPFAEESGNSAAVAEPSSNWEYSETSDEMRGSSSRFAQVTSDNQVDLDFPYGEVHGRITLRRDRRGLNVMFAVDKGQILCHTYGNSYINVKFDGRPIQRFSCTGPSDGSSETAFLNNEARFLSGVRKAKKTIIEAEFFQQGRQQFTFNTTGLKWK